MCATLGRGAMLETIPVGAGSVGWHPRGTVSSWTWESRCALALVCIDPALLRHLAIANGCADWLERETQACPARRDPFAERLVALFVDELRKPPHPFQCQISQALTQALGLHLVQRFHARPALLGPAPHGLSPQTLERVLDYIETHLHEHIALQSLAQVAHVSRFHFARLFKESTGCSPMAYLERRRIARAQLLMRQGEASLGKIAAMVGYADQSYFTRRFRLNVGMTPAVFARRHARAAAQEA
ncbi:hypothetical protein B0920_04675 [Massilia sp. KIM]|nr:hypothetical protein B0920_04675 [Massilia sp. KIM]